MMLLKLVSGHEIIVKTLLENGADLEAKDADGQKPLRRVVWNEIKAII